MPMGIVFDGQKAQVLGVDVDAVVLRQGDAGFELARQVGFAVNGFDRIVPGGDGSGGVRRQRGDFADIDTLARFVIREPNLMIGARARIKLFH